MICMFNNVCLYAPIYVLVSSSCSLASGGDDADCACDADDDSVSGAERVCTSTEIYNLVSKLHIYLAD